MGTLELIKMMADACYGFLALNFIWGLTCVILVWRRLRELSFRSLKAESEFVEGFEGLLQKNQFQAAEEQVEFDARALPRLCNLMLLNRKQSYTRLRQIVSETVQRHFLGDLEHRLGAIVTVIKSGPLLGLFGTVLGMMAAFGRIGTGEKVQPSQIADEISVALICTAMGLGTAIPLGYVLSYLSVRTRTLQESLESNLVRLLHFFRRNEE